MYTYITGINFERDCTFFVFTDFYFKLFLHCNPKRSYFFGFCFIKTQPFVKRKPVKAEKNPGTIAFRFRQDLL
jgi:hypothetical protein